MSKDYSNLEGLIGNVKESIRNAYDKGYKQGVNDGSLDVKMRVDGAYEKGLNDAWECARKIMLSDEDGGIAHIDIQKIFGGSYYQAMMNYSPSEAIAKIKEYEEKQKQVADEIKVGDEVYIIMENYPSVVTCIFSESGLDNPKAVHITKSGKYAVTPLSQLHKTGKHFDQIAEVLKQLNEVSE